MSSKEDILKRVSNKFDVLNKHRPLPEVILKKIQQQLRLEMTYNSNAIEGNTLNLRETSLVINEGITIKGKSLKEHLEVKDHVHALDYLDSLISSDDNKISESLIRDFHKIVMMDTDREWAGKYRESDVAIVGASFKPVDSFLISEKIKELLNEANSLDDLNIIEKVAIFHHKFVFIHPFYDGNGRTARLLMNYILLKNGYPLSIIKKNDRKRYYRALSLADKGNYENIIVFVAQAVEHSLDMYLRSIPSTDIKKEKLMLLSELTEHTEYSSKYLNLLISQGKLEAVKEGRNWKTSLEAINRYVTSRTRSR